MKKLIFITAFIDINYIRMLSLLVNTLYIYGNIDNNTDILIYTSSNFKNIIENSNFYINKIKIFTNDNINSIDAACKARLDLFSYDSIDNYSKILYLDTDILIQKNINFIFDLICEDKIYAIRDCCIDDDPNDFVGGQTLFKNEINDYSDKSGFNSGVMLFNNCSEIKKLFQTIKNHMNIDKSAKFNDQPYFVYNAKKYNLINNYALNDFVELTNEMPKTNKPILHISGGPGMYSNKLRIMLIYYKYMKKHTIMVKKS